MFNKPAPLARDAVAGTVEAGAAAPLKTRVTRARVTVTGKETEESMTAMMGVR